MANIVKLLSSIIAGNVPTLTEKGQVAINEADGILYYRNSVTGLVEKTTLRGLDTKIASAGGSKKSRTFFEQNQ